LDILISFFFNLHPEQFNNVYFVLLIYIEMETYANGATEGEMIDSLSFKVNPTANYITSRQSATYNAQGTNIYQSGTGSRVVRFTLSGTGQYLDPSTVRFQYTLVNKGGTNQVLYPLGGPWSFFRRGRVYSGAGAVLEDIDYMNRVHEMFHLLTSKANRDNDCNMYIRYDLPEDHLPFRFFNAGVTDHVYVHGPPEISFVRDRVRNGIEQRDFYYRQLPNLSIRVLGGYNEDIDAVTAARSKRLAPRSLAHRHRRVTCGA
jgi:hypothetical protein